MPSLFLTILKASSGPKGWSWYLFDLSFIESGILSLFISALTNTTDLKVLSLNRLSTFWKSISLQLWASSNSSIGLFLSSAQPESPKPAFSHPIEEEFARILDYYHIRWEYEPRTFALAEDEDGTVTEAFSPDFYLPDEDLYVELTTMRPKLIRHKNRKIRRLRERYPDIQVKLFNRKDLRNIYK